MSSRVEKALENHGKGYNCCQAVACAYADLVGVDENLIFAAGSNANEVVGEINDYLEIIEKELPKDVKIAHLMSTKDWGMQVSFRLTTYL